MATEVKIPNVGESITSANVARWHKQDGESVTRGETVLTIETDKVSNDLEAGDDGTLKILVKEGEEVSIGTVVGLIEESAVQKAPESGPQSPDQPAEVVPSIGAAKVIDIKVPAAGESITSANVGRWHVSNGSSVSKGDSLVTLETDKVSNELEAEESGVMHIIVSEGEEVNIGTVIATLTVGAAPQQTQEAQGEKQETSVTPAPPVDVPAPAAPAAAVATPVAPVATPAAPTTPSADLKPDLSVVPDAPQPAGQPQSEDNGRTSRRKMSMLRRKIASHLVSAQQNAAILTTFNEVDMSAIMKLRKEVQEEFVAKHGCKLGFMSFFVKATVQALKDVPSINGRIDGNDVIQNHFYDVGVAIGTEKGLVVPVLRDCDQKGFAEIEQGIIGYAGKANDGKMELADLQGGVFTISNGGVYGSLLSTPILNPPQSGILGMHTIQQRPMAVNGEVVILPMMYLALSYDHRLVDGKEAVTFLIRIKDCLENPSRLMLEM
jgi:2-oxoglutarate dehydrogenase E2 component (dihydrolipoamide succinyltransferase)